MPYTIAKITLCFFALILSGAELIRIANIKPL